MKNRVKVVRIRSNSFVPDNDNDGRSAPMPLPKNKIASISGYHAFFFHLREINGGMCTFKQLGEEWNKLNNIEKDHFKAIAEEYNTGKREIPKK